MIERGFYATSVDEDAFDSKIPGVVARSASSTAQNSITTVTDATGLTITFTVRANYPVEVHAHIPGFNAGNATALGGRMLITDAANVQKAQAAFGTNAVSGSYASSADAYERIVTPGTYTRKVRLVADSGMMTTGLGAGLAIGFIEATEKPVPF